MSDTTNPTAVASTPGPIESWLIHRIETRWPGTKSVIDQFAGQVPWDVINVAIITAFETFVPGGPSIITILQEILAAKTASTDTPAAS